MNAAERGATLLLAVGALAVAAALGAVMIANTQAELDRSTRFGERAGAASALDVAVSTAWGRIVDGTTTGFSDTGTTAGGPWSVTARPVTADRWEIDARSGAGVDEAAALVVVVREPAHPYTLRTEDAATGPLTGRVTGRVGITGTAVFSGRSPGDVQELVGDGASCTGCRNPVVVEARWSRPPPPTGSNPRPCPDTAGEITGVLAPGAYRCADPGTLRLTGTISVAGPVLLDLGAGVDLHLDNVDANGTGQADELIIVQPHSTRIDADDASLVGSVLAPGATLTTRDLTWRGTLDVGRLDALVGSRLDGAWDPSLESLGFQGWRIASWETTRA